MRHKSYSPLTAVLLRRLAWEQYVAQRQYTVDDIRGKHLPAARQELGLPPWTASDPAASAYLRSLFHHPKRLKLVGPSVRLVVDWEAELSGNCITCPRMRRYATCR